MEFTRFGEKFQESSGILELMDDLDLALGGASDRELFMLGGGNPGRLPAIEERVRAAMRNVMDDGDRFERLVGIYDNPQGDFAFRTELARVLGRELGRELTADHIALTQGSQNSFFYLFNALAGAFADGRRKRMMLPITPEYIGYADVGLEADFFRAARPRIETTGDHEFKYHVDFDALGESGEIGAYCVSRPTNPTGNVLADDELGRLVELACARERFLIVDGAYGLPFPGIVFTGARPVWDEHVILTLSLSKFGLPGVRTGILVARPEIARTIGRMNAVFSLSGGSLGPVLGLELLRDGSLMELSKSVIMPHYRAKSERARERLASALGPDLPWRIHKCEGAFFLWVWFEDLPIPTRELYARLKERGCLVVPGEYYFPGLEGDDWRHKQECIRVSYARDDEEVARGFALIAEEVRRAYAGG